MAALALTCWGMVQYLHPTTQCRGVAMGPGDVCYQSTYTEERSDVTQTYEQRVAIVRQQTPFVVGVGAVATVFGVVLLVRSGKQGHRSVDDPVTLHESGLSDAERNEIVIEQ